MKISNAEKEFASNSKVMTGYCGTEGNVGVCNWTSDQILISTTDEDCGNAWNVGLNKEQALGLALLLIEKARSLNPDG